MSAAPGCEFPNPCPVCGADDDHAEWRAQSAGSSGWMFGATHCPHPVNPGHGTGCCCAGISRETKQRQMQEALSRPTLEQRVAELEAVVERLTHPVVIAEFPPISDEDAARFKAELDAAMQDFRHKPPTILPSSLTVLDPESVRQLLRESVTVVKPGEVLVLRCPENWLPPQVGAMQDCIDWWLEENAPDIKVMVIPHLDMAIAEAPT